MATIRESLKKLVEVAKPVPGDEQDFVGKHVIKVFDPQGKDSIHPESPYELILKNVAVVKKPGDPGKDDHGHDAPGESEAAYHIPESRDAKIAKLSEMMGMMGPSYENGKDEDDEDEDEDEDDEDKKEVKEAKKQVVGVEMHYKHATKKPFKVTHFSVQDAERGRKDYEKMGYKLVGKKAQMGEEAEQVDENLPLLPKQKQIARDLLKKEMEDRKKQRNDNRQAGTPKLMEEDRRDANNEVRQHVMATPRLVHKADTFKKMKDMLQSVNKHDNVGS